MDVIMKDTEFSYFEIFQNSGNWLPLFMADQNINVKPITSIDGISSVLKTGRNNICVAKASHQSARKYKEKFPTETEDQGSLHPVLTSGNTFSEILHYSL